MAEELDQEEIEEGGTEEEISVVGGGALNLLTPEGIIMMSIALILDGIGIILILFVLDDFFITDIIALSTIGVWLYFRSGATLSMPERVQQKTKGAASTAAKAADAEKAVQKVGGEVAKSSRWLKPALCFGGEFITWVGAFPFLTYLVYSELTKTQ